MTAFDKDCECYARECVRLAGLTEDQHMRDQLLNMARGWMAVVMHEDKVPEPKTVKNRMHICLRPTDRNRDDEIERILGLGATLVNDLRNGPDKGWAVLADPEGNEFCVLRQFHAS